MIQGELRGNGVVFGKPSALFWPDFPHGFLGSSAELVPLRKASECKVISVALGLTGISGLWHQTDEMRGRFMLAVSFLTQEVTSVSALQLEQLFG